MSERKPFFPKHPLQALRRSALMAAAGLALAASSGLAQAADYWFDIVNNTTQSITEVWVSPVGSRYWGDAFSGVFVRHSGGSQRLEFSHGNEYASTCRFDVRVEFSGGQRNYWSNVDLCSTNGLVVGVSQGKVVATAY